MQKVSQAWKDNQNKTLVSESDIEISLKMTDPDAYKDATADDNGHVNYADTNHIVSDGDKTVTPYATLENNQWLLDGSREILPDSNYGEVGYVGSVLSEADGTYSTHPIVDLAFSRVHNNLLQGITIKWSEFLNEYAKDFIVTIYHGDTVVAQETVTDNAKLVSEVAMDISGYDSITIEILKWSMAYRRPRIDDIFIGMNKVFTKRDIFSYDCSLSVDPISAELPKAEVSFSIDNLNDTYNPYNDEGLSKYLMERQEIEVRYGYKLDNGTEWISGGKYYVSEWDAEQNGMSADFKARDLLEFMTGTYYKGLYNPEGTSLYDLAEDVLQDAGLPLNSDDSVKWVIDERLKDIYTVAPLPIDTHANCLQMIANASESVMYQDRDGTLRLTHVATGNLIKAENLSHLYVDGVGVLWDNPNLYSYIIPIEPFVTYEFRTKYLSNLRNIVFAKGEPKNNDVTYSLDGEKGVASQWHTTEMFQITPNDKDYTHLIVSFYSAYDSSEYTLDEIMGGIYLGRGTQGYDISYFNSYSKSGLSLSKPLKQVDVPCYSYSVATEKSELYKGALSISGTQDVLVTYSGSATNVTTKVVGGTLNSITKYTNGCVLNITASGDVTITVEGYALESSSVMISTMSGESGETVSVDNPLITSQARAVAVGKWIETYMKNRMTLSSDWRADPRLDALDMVDNENDYGTSKVLMTNVKYSYKGAFRGSGEGRVV